MDIELRHARELRMECWRHGMQRCAGVQEVKSLGNENELLERNKKDLNGNKDSSFHRHVSRVLGNDEVSALLKQQSKYKWETSSMVIPKSKWVGTGEKMQMIQVGSR